MVNPRDIAGERRNKKNKNYEPQRYSWGTQKKKKNKNDKKDDEQPQRYSWGTQKNDEQPQRYSWGERETDRQTDRDRGGLGWNKCKRVKGKRSSIDHVKTLPACKANIYHSRTGMHAREKRLAIDRLY